MPSLCLPRFWSSIGLPRHSVKILQASTQDRVFSERSIFVGFFVNVILCMHEMHCVYSSFYGLFKCSSRIPLCYDITMILRVDIPNSDTNKDSKLYLPVSVTLHCKISK